MSERHWLYGDREAAAALWVPLAVMPAIESTLPGFDPVGLWVKIRTPGAEPRAALVTSYSPSHAGVVGRFGVGESLWLDQDPSECPVPHIDLADATTRDRCLRWLAARHGVAPVCGSPAWDVSGWDHHDASRSYREARIGDREYTFALPLDFNDTDDRRLPDGSLYAHALALALVLRREGT